MIASFLLDPYSLSEANAAVECIFSRDFVCRKEVILIRKVEKFLKNSKTRAAAGW